MTHSSPRPFLAWPGWAHLGFAGIQSFMVCVWFGVVYGGCDYLTQYRTLIPVHMPWELSIPLVPAMTVFYSSIFLLFAVGPFILRTRAEVRAIIRALIFTIALAGVGFLLLPSTVAYYPPGDLGPWAGLYQWADAANLQYNMAPSLHVALSVCCLSAFATHASPPLRSALWLWATAIALSTLLTHQHHLLDVVTGWPLGLWARRRFAPSTQPP